jgi:probable rRNA maturation factor
MPATIEILDEDYNLDPDFFLVKLQPIIEKLNLNGGITIKLGNEEESRALNATYRKKDAPTDVLSFPFDEELPDGFYLGDIFICYPVAEKQAKENNVPLQQELLTLMLHGILHLSGLDHETDTGEMEVQQEQLIKEFF